MSSAPPDARAAAGWVATPSCCTAEPRGGGGGGGGTLASLQAVASGLASVASHASCSSLSSGGDADTGVGSLLGAAAPASSPAVDDEAHQQRFEEFARTHLLPFLRLQPHGAALLRAYMVELASRPDEPWALPRLRCLIHASRPVLPTDQRLLKPMALLIDTALRCVYASPQTDEEALELMTEIYKDLPNRDEALACARGNV